MVSLMLLHLPVLLRESISTRGVSYSKIGIRHDKFHLSCDFRGKMVNKHEIYTFIGVETVLWSHERHFGVVSEVENVLVFWFYRLTSSTWGFHNFLVGWGKQLFDLYLIIFLSPGHWLIEIWQDELTVPISWVLLDFSSHTTSELLLHLSWKHLIPYPSLTIQTSNIVDKSCLHKKKVDCSWLCHWLTFSGVSRKTLILDTPYWYDTRCTRVLGVLGEDVLRRVEPEMSKHDKYTTHNSSKLEVGWTKDVKHDGNDEDVYSRISSKHKWNKRVSW